MGAMLPKRALTLAQEMLTRGVRRSRRTNGAPHHPPERPMSVIVRISSALPPATDVGSTPGECLSLKQRRPTWNKTGARVLISVGLHFLLDPEQL